MSFNPNNHNNRLPLQSFTDRSQASSLALYNNSENFQTLIIDKIMISTKPE